MTWWAPLEVLGFALKGGFTATQAKQATAIALAASGGADHYQWAPPGSPGTDVRGLWGITAHRYDPDELPDLFSPVSSAQAVCNLWARYGRSWSFHYAYNVDGGKYVRDVLAQLEQGKNWKRKSAAQLTTVRQLAVIHHATEQMRAVVGGTVPLF